MAGVDLNREALARLRVSVHTQAGKLATVGDGFPAKDAAGSSLFGTLTGATELAAAIGTVETHVDEEMTAVKNRLDGVERALDTVEDNIQKAEHHTKSEVPVV